MRTIKTTTAAAYKAIRLGLDFTTYGALSGAWESTAWTPDYGRMPRDTFEEMRTLVEAARERGERRVYVIRSYATPIALMFEDGTTWEPGVRYSVTTSRHQTAITLGLIGYRERVAAREEVTA